MEADSKPIYQQPQAVLSHNHGIKQHLTTPTCVTTKAGALSNKYYYYGICPTAHVPAAFLLASTIVSVGSLQTVTV
jgi:hypothetical protein